MFVNSIIEWKINEILLNSLFSFSGKFVRIWSRSKSSNASDFSKIITNIKKINLKKYRTHNHKLDTKSTKKKIDKPELQLSFWEKFILLFKNKKKLTAKEIIYNEYIDKIKKKIDIIELLRKLEEIEKIKNVLFNEKQLLLFNSLSKRCVKLSKTTNNLFLLKYTQNLKNIEVSQQKDLENYLNEVKNNKNLDSLDYKLFNLIE